MTGQPGVASNPSRVLVWYWGQRGAGAHYTEKLVFALTDHPELTVGVSLATRNLRAEHTGSAVRSVCHCVSIVDIHRRRGVIGLLLGALALSRQLARYKPDVVLHSMVGPFTCLVWPLVRLVCPRASIVSVIHNAAPHVGDRKLLADASGLLAMRRSDHVVVLSKAVAARVALRTSRPITVIPLGPLLGDVQQPSLWDPAGPIVLVGRLSRYKGLSLLAAAWARVDGTSDLALRVIGEPTSDPEVEKALCALEAHGVHVERRWLRDDEFLDSLRGARCVVLPYIEASQSGVVPISHAVGVPVLATNVGALPEQVADGGWMIEPTEGALFEAIMAIAANSDEVAAAHIRALNIARETSWANIGTTTAALLGQAARDPYTPRRRRVSPGRRLGRFSSRR